MLVYLLLYFTFVIVLLAGTIPEVRRFEKTTLLFVMVVLWFVISFSESVGPDYNSYRFMYDTMNDSFQQQEILFKWIGGWFRRNNYTFQYFYFFITSLYLFLLCYIFERYRNYLSLNLLIFIIMPYGLIEGGFTYIRQNVAVAIFYLSLIYIVDKKLIRYVGCTAVAMLFHKSAAMVIPIYYIGKNEINTKKSLVVYFTCLLFSLLLFFPDFKSFIFSVISLIPGYGQTYLEFRGGEFLEPMSLNGVASYVYQALPMILLMIYRDEVVKTPIDNLLYNLAFISLITLTLALQMRIMLRVEYYFIISKVFVLPLLLNVCKSTRNRTISLLIMIAYFSIYFIALYMTGFEKELFPYRTIFGFEV